ncbi:MAG TPA: DUF1643 domain-containing protein, partial [Bradyrhizobium sp.]|nr:DUF1643 domain-containing protein [Bradyrhizobium sp.]
LLKTNAYAWRSTDRTALYTLADPVGHSCDDWIRAACRRSQQTIVAWGADCPRVMANRPREILSILSDERVMPYAFKVVGKGQPGHPLYLPYSLQPRPLWELLSE